MGDSYRDMVADGLKKMKQVLDYATDSDEMRYNILVWTKDAVDALLRGEEVKLPPRKFKK